ncbi:hypothetical protein [Jiangella alkaliphila]|uniref:Secreted protein n=1 Tax=Jiangella alkaliphila TaxID=419479 RepID=A0A1H2JTC6_9ACTN|nr:hypothetical protein [Jiangella alkaliphila]SDU59667.1 hypothetical protein SAMN04488563_3054 [Jiangella alkaliphila]
MTRSTRRGIRLLPVIALLLTVTLTACGSDDGDDDVSAAGTGDSTSDSGGGSGGGETDPEQAELDFYECMRENGVDMPDPDPGQPGIQLQVPPGAEAAMEECRSLLPNGGDMAQTDADDLESLRAFTACMRENGIDMPDPAADGGLSMPEGVDPQSAEFQTAMTTCQPELNGAPIRIGPGPGGGQ